MIVRMKDVSKSYQSGGKQIKALNTVSLEIVSGESALIMGPSGSGKSTLLYILGLLLDIDNGELELFDTTVESLDRKEWEKIRLNRIGFVFQDFELLPKFTVEENMGLAFLAAGGDRHSLPRHMNGLIGRFELRDRKRHYPNELSVGEKQRAAICRALINDPELILADEPTAHLDSAQGSRVVDELIDLSVSWKKTLVVVSHDDRLRDKFHRVFTLHDGRLSLRSTEIKRGYAL